MNEHGIKHDRSQALIDYAYQFAKTAHGDQKRKYTNDPYISHPVAVANIVASVTEDVDMICAAMLHDVIEDTNVTYEDIRDSGFGYRCAQFVLMVTDVSTANDGLRKHRKELDRLHLAKADPCAKTIKLADLIHNTSSILKYDERFAKIYMQEKKDLLSVLSEGNSNLYKIAWDIVNNYYEMEDK